MRKGCGQIAVKLNKLSTVKIRLDPALDLGRMPSLFPSPFPNLPDFNSLLVLGPYHASASIYLSLSFLSDHEGEPIILSPSRSTLLQALQAFNDSWLATNSGAGKISEELAKIAML